MLQSQCSAAPLIGEMGRFQTGLLPNCSGCCVPKSWKCIDIWWSYCKNKQCDVLPHSVVLEISYTNSIRPYYALASDTQTVHQTQPTSGLLPVVFFQQPTATALSVAYVSEWSPGWEVREQQHTPAILDKLCDMLRGLSVQGFVTILLECMGQNNITKRAIMVEIVHCRCLLDQPARLKWCTDRRQLVSSSRRTHRTATASRDCPRLAKTSNCYKLGRMHRSS